MSPHEEGSPFVTIIKITSFFSWDLQSRLRDVSVFLLRFSKTSHPIESDNDKRDRFRLRGRVIEFPSRKSIPCKHINSLINGACAPFMFCFVSKETSYAGLLDAFASTGSNLKNLKIKKGSG